MLQIARLLTAATRKNIPHTSVSSECFILSEDSLYFVRPAPTTPLKLIFFEVTASSNSI